MSDVVTKEYVDKIMATMPLFGTVVPGASIVGAHITKACADNLAEAREAASLMNFTARRLEQRLKDAMGEVDEYRRAIVNLEAKIQQLEDWKESALAVEREWNANAIATMLGGQPGESQRKVIQREVPKLLARIKRLEEAGNKMAGRLYDGWPDLDGDEVIADMDALVEGWNEAKEAKP